MSTDDTRNSPSPALVSHVEHRRTRHLDLGCGSRPRNPYNREELYGVDIRGADGTSAVEIRRANVAIDPIPYPDNQFDSVSAYDFLEHVPRILPTPDGTRFPFVELMNEIWRVLIPGGRLYAFTPAYPHAAVFRDPTHVNILTRDSHIYFTRPMLMARMYGFIGDFSVIRVLPAKGGEHLYEPAEALDFRSRYRFRRRERRGQHSHIIWEFETNKPA
jgi:SAM-dependent methyltransferase